MMAKEISDKFLSPTETFDSDHPSVLQFAQKHTNRKQTDREKAISLYKEIRDGFLYNPFDIHFDFNKVKSSSLLSRNYGHCVDKAGLMVSACRSLGVPARIGLAKVRNHMGTARLEEILKTNILVPHGYADIFIEGKWVKCTPAFNKSLCEKLGVKPLEWDGRNDSLFQQFDREDSRFMEYIEDYGTFGDIPQEFIQTLMRKEYPHLIDKNGDFRWEVLK